MQAKIFFGSKEADKDNHTQRRNPFSLDIVSSAPICSEDDAKKALEIAKEAFVATKSSTLAQRCNWLLDVASKLREQK
jgi:acyl-CoA reductase-like NAD-dependent aldehyde dehydrogenase